MKSLVSTLLTISLLAPSATFAFSIDEIIANAKAGGGTVVESHSSASTGGQTVSSGQSVSTGDSSASSHVETRITSGTNGGEVKVKIETSENGVTHTEEYSKPVAPGEKIQVLVGTSTKGSIKKGDAAQRPHATAPARLPASTSTSPEATTSPATIPTTLLTTPESSFKILFSTKIPAAFKRVFSFLWVF